MVLYFANALSGGIFSQVFMFLQNGEYIKKYEEIYSFISRIGVCRVLSSSDIVQFALAECKTSYVYAMGEKLAKNSDAKYFEYL